MGGATSELTAAVSISRLDPWAGARRRAAYAELDCLGGDGASRDRTDDLRHAMAALSQLSYSPGTINPIEPLTSGG
jgi:hypothetical protein